MTPEEGIRFVEEHGAALEAARGPIPSLAVSIVGGPIRGSWWGHERSHEIYAVTSRIRESEDVLVCKLVEGKVTFVHRRLWPALVRLADEFGRERLERVDSVHTETGRHINVCTPFPEWVPAEVVEKGSALSVDAARAQLPKGLRDLVGKRRGDRPPGPE